jgi:hypothetical protein
MHHAVVFVDHHRARIIEFGSERTQERNVNSHLHLASQHEKDERAQHEFFGKVCDGLDGIAQVLVVGGHTSLSDFNHYVDKHRPQTATRIDSYQVQDHQSDNQLVALAREWFNRNMQMVGIAV